MQVNMKFATYLQLGLIGLLAATALGCSKKDTLEAKVSYPYTTIINGHEYRFEPGRITELTLDNDTEVRYGVLSDIHGEVGKIDYFLREFEKQNIEAILVPGDIALNEQLRYGQADAENDTDEIITVLKMLGKTGLPIYVIPGNHETRESFAKALGVVTKEYPNVIDMTQYRVLDGDDADIISLPGYQTFSIPGRKFIPDDSYWANRSNVDEIQALRVGLDDPVILLTHGAGKTGVSGPATLYSGEDAGDVYTTQVQREAGIPFAVVGHIHEAGGRAATFDGTAVSPETWATQFTVNFGTLQEWKYVDGVTRKGMGGVFMVKGKEAKFEIIGMP